MSANELSAHAIDFLTNTMLLTTGERFIELLKQRGVTVDDEIVNSLYHLEEVAIKAGFAMAETTKAIAAMAAAD